MSTFLRCVTFRRLIAALLVPTVAACSTVVSLATPQEYIAAQRPARVWIGRGEGPLVAVTAPRLLGDTLIGYVDGEYREVPLAEVRLVRVRQSAPRRTALLVTATVLAAAGFLYITASAGQGDGFPTYEDPSVPGAVSGRR